MYYNSLALADWISADSYSRSSLNILKLLKQGSGLVCQNLTIGHAMLEKRKAAVLLIFN